GDFIDPINFLECFTTGNGNNRTGYSSEAYDSLIAGAACEPDANRRVDLFQQAEAMLLADAPLIPIYFYRRVYLKSPDVKGWNTNVLGYISFKDLYFEHASPQNPERRDG
ncbi:MAG TPA: peptide ABC transporter substrate-binding protein, partial [Candidatus Hydrogenedentes bacterium]|nr:peptide ABC transporter substrate-binding protein [Candidatus Hydrogenedentota bacterium]